MSRLPLSRFSARPTGFFLTIVFTRLLHQGPRCQGTEKIFEILRVVCFPEYFKEGAVL
jgi:hypothetical protein